MLVSMRMCVAVVMIVIMRVHVELHSFDAGLLFASGVQVVFEKMQLRQFVFELFERHAQVQQRADEHVAADAAEDIEIKTFHFG